jgi:hypothetical protein
MKKPENRKSVSISGQTKIKFVEINSVVNVKEEALKLE